MIRAGFPCSPSLVSRLPAVEKPRTIVQMSENRGPAGGLRANGTADDSGSAALMGDGHLRWLQMVGGRRRGSSARVGEWQDAVVQGKGVLEIYWEEETQL